MFKFFAAIQYATEVGVSGCWPVEENAQQKMGVSTPKPSVIRDSPAETWSYAMTGGDLLPPSPSSVPLPDWREADSKLQG